MADSMVEQIKSELSQMQSERSGFDSHWQDLVDYLLPFRQAILANRTQGAKAMTYIKDSTGTLSLLLFAAGISSKMANKAIPWFRLEVEDEEMKRSREVKLWLDRVETIFYQTFERSNFYTADQEANIDVGGFGTAPMFIGPHPQWGCCYHTLNISECYVATDAYGQIDTLYRKFPFTAKQIKEQWGRRAHEAVNKSLGANRPLDQGTVVHAVKPRKQRDRKKIDSRNLPWMSVYIDLDHNHLMEEGGFYEFPYVVSRYFVMPGEVYGRSLGMVALPDVKELQVRVRDTTRAGQLALDPPVLLPHDSFAGQPIKRIPGGFTFVRADGAMQDKIGVFPTAGNLPWSENEMEQMRQRIGRTFFSDLMLLAMDKQVTLGEFLHVAQEKMQLLGPFLGRLQTERYNPLFDRTFSLLWDQGRIPPPPPELVGEDGRLKYRVEYISPLAKAQKLSESQGIIQATGFLGQVAAANPEILDILDWDEAGRLVLENYGVPIKLIRDQDMVGQLRQMRAQAQQQQQAAAMALEGAKTLPALSKGPEAGSVMDQLSQALQQGAGNA
jgi:hypothetical protein